MCQWIAALHTRPLRILETCQEFGDATVKYRRYGYVVSFEKDPDVYAQARARFPNALSLFACLRENRDLTDIAEKCRDSRGNFPVIMPNKNMVAESGMKMLIDHTLRFDLIDVDPFGAPDAFFPDAFELLDDRSFLFVTTGEMHAVRFDPQKFMTRRGVKASSSLKWARKFFRDYCGEIVGAKIVELGFEYGVSLHPVFMYNYYVHPGGVHRLGYYAHRDVDVSERAQIKTCLVEDSTLGVKRIKCKKLMKNGYDATLPCKFFSKCEEKEMEKAITQRLAYLNRK